MDEVRTAEEALCEATMDPAPQAEDEKIDLQEGGEYHEAEARTDKGDPSIPLDPPSDPDPDSLSDPAEDQAGRLDQLRGELIRLQAALEKKQTQLSRIEKEYEDFCALFPGVALSELTDATWRDVENGNSLAAAFALAERRRMVAEEKAARLNKENRARSSGAMSNVQNEYYSPEEVRTMSGAEVRKNYQKIMQSMQHWH